MSLDSAAPDRCDGCGGEIGYGETILVVYADGGARSVREAVAGTCDAAVVAAAYHPACCPAGAATDPRSS